MGNVDLDILRNFTTKLYIFRAPIPIVRVKQITVLNKVVNRSLLTITEISGSNPRMGMDACAFIST